MFRKNRLSVHLMLVFALSVQVLPSAAQQITKSSGGSAAENGTSVDLKKIRLVGKDTAVAEWDVALVSGVEVQGFDVRVEATLSDGKIQTLSRSFGSNDRTGEFDFKLPLLTDGTIGPAVKPSGTKNSPAGGNTGSGGGGATIDPVALCKFDCNRQKKANEVQKCIDQCLKTAASKNVSTRSTGTITPGGKIEPFGPGVGSNANGGGVIKPVPKPAPKPDAVRITSLRAFITAKFAIGVDLAAFREFVQPIDKVTAELTPKAGRGSALQVNKLIQVSQLARFASECPSSQDCFDVIAEVRGAAASGQFKVTLEAVYPNGVRRNASRIAGNLLRPVRLAVDRPAGVQLGSALVNINGVGNREEFTRKDTAAVGILLGS
ncbi:MAG: hypothetical protein ABI882_20850 [Acidobacteriota bacterium]